MKNYFKFNLTGKQVLPVWIYFMVLFLVPYAFVQFKLQGFQHAQSQDPHEVMARLGMMMQWYGVMFLLLLVQYSILFFLAKLSIEAVEFKEKEFSFAGKFGQFLGVLIPNFLLCIITLGIYSPWFITKMITFFAQKSSNDSNNFEFKGKGGDLFLIVLFTLIIPMMVMTTIVMIFAFRAMFQGSATPGSSPFPYAFLLMMSAIFILFIPYFYYVYKWMVNFKYKNYAIQWETSFWNASAKIALEIFLSIVTLGIYLPLASLKLYQYFAERTIATSETTRKRFGYDLESKDDFLLIWGQALLVIITLGIYYPWAYCKITSRILEKSYSQQIATVE